MKRIIILLVIVLTSVNLFGQTNYYVSHHVDSTYNDMSDIPTLSPGDTVFLHAGEVWREQYSITESGTSDNWIVFTRYGDGVNPKILGSDKQDTWTATGTANIWQSSTSLNNPMTVGSYGAEIFFMTDDSVSWGDYQTYTSGYTNLTAEYDWTYNGSTFYVYASSDPDTRYDSIEAPQRINCVRMMGNNAEEFILIDGVDFHFGIEDGFYSGYPAYRGIEGLIVRNCNISYIGHKGSSHAYGIVAWQSNVLIENCTFSDCGRRAISFNLYLQREAGTYRNISNVVVRNNTFKRGQHTTSLDLACTSITGDTIQDVYFYNNIVDDHELTMTGEDETSNQVFIQEGGAYFNNINIINNLLIEATARNIIFEGSDTSRFINNTVIGHNPNISTSPYGNVSLTGGLEHLDFRNNIQYDNLGNNSLDNYGLHGYNIQVDYFERDYNLYWQLYPGNDRDFTSLYNGSTSYYYDIDQWSSYLSTWTDFDQNSPTPEDPYFIDYDGFDFRLTDSSAAVGAGTPISLSFTDPEGTTIDLGEKDILGNDRSATAPSIGAYEYFAPDSSDKYITRFTIVNQVSSTIDTAAKTVSVVIPFGVSRSSLTPTITLSTWATVSPTSGSAQNFTSPVTYTVTAADESTQDWTVTVNNEAASTETDIIAFSMTEQFLNASINVTTHTISLQTDYGTDLTGLSPEIEVSEGASISPASGVSRDFTNPRIYTVTAQDELTSQNWTVTVTAKPTPQLFMLNGKLVKVKGSYKVHR